MLSMVHKILPGLDIDHLLLIYLMVLWQWWGQVVDTFRWRSTDVFRSCQIMLTAWRAIDTCNILQCLLLSQIAIHTTWYMHMEIFACNMSVSDALDCGDQWKDANTWVDRFLDSWVDRNDSFVRENSCTNLFKAFSYSGFSSLYAYILTSELFSTTSLSKSSMTYSKMYPLLPLRMLSKFFSYFLWAHVT